MKTKTNYNDYDLATIKQIIDATFPALKNKKYKVWINYPNICMLQCYEGKEFYGHEFIVDIDNKTLKPYVL